MPFYKGPKCLDEGPKCPIGAEVVGAEVVGAEVSKIPKYYRKFNVIHLELRYAIGNVFPVSR